MLLLWYTPPRYGGGWTVAQYQAAIRRNFAVYNDELYLLLLWYELNEWEVESL